ncbi:hypothetical protein YK48G_14530 [Lentilactobacillus fungorum]|uniref:Gram-positive cocci surface proteins LPxTG domain-containing protein n=1 Tax=Lentilactobacillus fungorum TaxID=2201250 RepID=A0ABQ3VYQ1_9LACO|nr:MBG domain-containing protein [Lentilactobacillus fungorum]GHP14028.1 hypothetical protein YK48G_14530 [Lentilactobacillus fungorum]
MNRYQYNTRLFRDSLEKQEHYKLYKKGKLWLVAGISMFTTGLSYTMLTSHPVHADTTATYDGDAQAADASTAATAVATKPDVNTTSTNQTSDSAQTSTAANTASTTSTATTQSSATAASNPTGEITGTSSSSTQAATDNQATQTSQAAQSSQASSTKDTTSIQAPTSTKVGRVDKHAKNELKVKKTSYKKLTKYSKQSAQTIINQANKAIKATQKQIAKGNTIAGAKSDDNIPQDDALTAISTHQKAEQAQVLKTVKAAQKLAIKNKKQATTKLNTALAVVANMHDELNQATALVAADKKGVKAHVVANAKAAYNQVSVPNGTSAKVDDYGDLIITASNARSYNQVLKTIHKQGLTGSFRQIVDPAEAASLTLSGPTGITTTDTDGNITIDRSKATGQGGVNVSVTFNISGNKGDKFFVTTPNAPGSVSDSSIATSVQNSDGSTTTTWTLDQDNVTKKENLNFEYGRTPAYVYNDLSKSPDTGNFWPGANTPDAETDNGVVPDGTILPISYGGTNIDTQYKKVTLDNKRTIDAMSLGSPQGSSAKKAGQNYTYVLSFRSNVTGFNSLGVVTAVIDLPANFVFDSDETDYIQRNSYRSGIGVNSFKVLPGNKLQITSGGQNHAWAFNDSTINFAGHYTDGTTGSQTFKVESFKTAYLPGGDGKAPVVNDNGGEKQFTTQSSDFNSGHLYDFPNTTFTDTLTTNNTTSLLIIDRGINASNTLLIGSTTNNVLANFRVANTGNTTVDPTYTIKIPNGVDSTGINLPLNQAINSNWPKDTTYDVTVNYSDGSYQTFTKLGSGTTVSSINGTDVQLMTIPTNAHVTNYVITQSKQIAPDNFMGTQYNAIGDGDEAWWVESTNINDNDIVADAFTVLGNVGTKNVAPVTDGQKLSINLNIADKNSSYTTSYDSTFTATDKSTAELSFNSAPGSVTPGQTFTTYLTNGYGSGFNTQISANLNANAFRDSKGQVINKPSATDPNDQTSYSGNSRSIFEPVIYITTPAQTKLVPNAKTGLPITEAGIGWNGVNDTPKVSTFVNADGLTVTKMDYTGTGFEWTPLNQGMALTFKVNDDAVSAFVPWNNSEATGDGSYNGISYVNNRDFKNSGLTSSNNSATKFGTTGESVAVVMVKGDAVSNARQTSLSDLQNLYIQTADGQKITGLSAIQNGGMPGPTGAGTLVNDSKLSGYFFINAPQSMILNGTIQDNQSFGSSYSANGVNNPMKNDAQSIRLRLANNTANTSTNVGGVINLPTEVTANSGDTPGKFALQLTGAAKEGKSTSGDTTTTLYSTGKATLSADGKYVTLADGNKYYFNSADGKSTTTADDLMTANKVTDWSKIVGIVTSIPKLASQDMADVILPVKDPDSANDRGKQVTIPTAFRVDGLNNVNGSITDSFTTTAHIKNVDQDGNVINGFPGSNGGYSDDGMATPPTGVAGSKILNNIPTIPGYVFTTTDGDTTIKLDGSSTLVNHFQVDQATLTTKGRPKGELTDTAFGNTAANTGDKTATGTDTITFKYTDKDLAANGGVYQVTGPDGKDYATLAEALAANPTFDLKSDATGATQTFTVTFTQTPVDQDSIILQPKTKQYDGDASTDPTTFDVKLANGVVAPTAGWITADFDVTGITSQNVGSYAIKLSAQGLTDLQKANPTKVISMADVTNTQFTITKAPVTITVPTVTKTYDGQPYTDTLTAKVEGEAAKGDKVKYSLSDLSKDVDVGSYDIDVTADAAANPNYDIKVVAGKLTITPTATTGNVVIGNQTKVYDGDASTDPTTFEVTLPKGMTAPKDDWVAADFDTSKITSQNVGSYEVTLSQTGLAKLQAANPNTAIDANSVTAGKFTITPAPITITGPTVTKVYDGQPYTDKTKLVATIAGKPKAGVDLTTPQLGDISKDVNVGDYEISVTVDTAANPNYAITTKPGQLTITPSTTTDKVVVDGGTKTYDNDASTDPTTFKVTLPKGMTTPKDGWTKDDFDTSGITSQNVGNYAVTLSKTGLAKLQAANKNTAIDAKSVTAGTFTITPAKVTVTGPTVTKVYDGKPYSDQTKLVATVTDKPAKGVDVVYQLADISQDVNAGSYDIAVTADAKANPNYEVTVVAGKLTITPTATTDKVVVDGGTKVYDGDASTDPATFEVTLPSGIVAPTAGWTKDDFDTTGITSQNVGNYPVTLSQAGLAKLQAANVNTAIDANNVTAGKFTITKAPITITGPTLTKTYDGKPYAGVVTATVAGQPAKGDQVTYQVGDLSQDVAIGNYPVNVTAAANNNPNYTITIKPGTLTITPAPVDKSAINLQPKAKTYDGDASTDPTTFEVKLDDGLVAPKAGWTAADFDTTGITSQNVGAYAVKLSAQGLADLQQANPTKAITMADVTNTQFIITKANVTITVPSVTKQYDGQPYSGTINATISNKPTKGDDVKYTLTDISHDVEVGSYDVTATVDANANPNYNVEVIPGKLTITADYKLTINYVDEKGKPVAPATTKDNMKTGDDYTSKAIVVQKYYLIKSPTTPSGKVTTSDVTLTYVYRLIGKYIITPPANQGDVANVVYPNDPDDPAKILTPTTGIVPYISGYNAVDSDGHILKLADAKDPSKGYLPPTAPYATPDKDTYITYQKVSQPTNQPTTQPTQPVQPTTQPTNQPTTQPTQPAQPTQQPAQPTQQPAQPTTSPKEPTKTANQPAKPAVQKTKSRRAKAKGTSTTKQAATPMSKQQIAKTPVKVAGMYKPKPAQQLNQMKQVSNSKQAANQQLAAKRLPQTGDNPDNGAVLLGVIGMLSTIGLAALRKKRRQD